MVSNYKRKGKKKIFTQAQKKELIAKFKNDKEKVSLRQFAIQNGIAEQTFRDWVAAEDKLAGTGKATGLSAKIEKLLVLLMVMLSASGLPMGMKHLPGLVQRGINCGAIAVNPKVKFRNNKPGRAWIRNFKARHSTLLTLSKRESLQYKRAKAMTAENKGRYFDKLNHLITQHNILPENIWNCDEAGFQADSAEQTVWNARGLRNAYGVVADGTRALFSVLFCCSAVGKYLPTLTIFKAKNFWHQWTVDGDPDALYTHTESGWMEERIFQNWFMHIFVPRTVPADPSQPRLLIFDGHSSHISFDMAWAAVQNNIHLLCLPPHTTHALQPLDVACFRSAKAVWAKVVNAFFMKHGGKKTLAKEDFPACLKVVSDHLQEHPEFVKNGFRRCGIVPLDRTAGDDKVGS